MPQDESVVERAVEYFFPAPPVYRGRPGHPTTGQNCVTTGMTREAPTGRRLVLSAAVKRYKTYEMPNFFFQIADEAGLDYTPLVVKRLCAHLFRQAGQPEYYC